MRTSLLATALLALPAGCSSVGIVGHSPAPVAWGRDGYDIRAVWGGLGATRREATEALDREARRLCKLGYSRVAERERERLTTWGTGSGQTDIVWTVSCNEPMLSA